MKIERLNIFNLQRYSSVLPREFLALAETQGIPNTPGSIWLGCRDDNGNAIGSIVSAGISPTGPIPDKHASRFSLVYVKKDFRRKGIASAMLRELLKQLPDDISEFHCTYQLPKDEEADIFVRWCERNGFHKKISGERFLFDPNTFLSIFENDMMPEFDIIPVVGEFPNLDQIRKREKEINDQLDTLLYTSASQNSTQIRKLRNQMILTPKDDCFQIIEHATGKEAGFFSCDPREDCYQLNALCIHPEYRHRIFLWKKVACVFAREAIARHRILSWTVLFWRPEFSRWIKQMALAHPDVLLHREVTVAFWISPQDFRLPLASDTSSSL